MPREQTFHRSIDADHELRVFTYARWHRDCSPPPPPEIVLLRTSPTHGTVSLRPGPTMATFIRVGEPDCTGQTYQGLACGMRPRLATTASTSLTGV